MYAVGRPHPLQPEAREFFLESIRHPGPRLVTSAEVLQELLHAYLAVGRLSTFDAAMLLVGSRIQEVFSVEEEDVHLARALAEHETALGARDLLHVACCRRRNVGRVKTFDRALATAFVAGT